jgi:hypothetical protein
MLACLNPHVSFRGMGVFRRGNEKEGKTRGVV